MRTATAAALTLLAALGCSGKDRPAPIGSPEYDAGDDDSFHVDAIPIADRSNQCGGMQMRLSRRQADVLFVIDRSGSMGEMTRDGSTKWLAMLRAFRDVLPTVESDLSMGLILFPHAVTVMNPTPEMSCAVGPMLDEAPRLMNATQILAQLNRSLPNGATPTWAALTTAANFWRSNPDRTGQRYVVLATDGGPNCNGSFDNHTCRCSNPNQALCRNDMNIYARYNCLDDDRTVAAIRELRAIEVPTYVIGLPGTEEFEDVLSAMAVAGGRARDGTPRYFSVTTSDELLREFNSITSGLIECTFRLDQSPPDENLVDVRLGAESLIHDINHHDGWDWADDTRRQIDFYGMTCARVRASSGGTVLSAAFGCPAPTPP